MHRCFTEAILFDKEKHQVIKKYIWVHIMGRIVISTGNIATDATCGTTENMEYKTKEIWKIKYDKEGITIEPDLAMVKISRETIINIFLCLVVPHDVIPELKYL